MTCNAMLTCLPMTHPYKKCLDSHDFFKVINVNLLKLSIYGTKWLITFNALKTEYIIVFKRKTSAMHPDLLLNYTKLTEVNNHKHLGLTISNNMSWSSHINEILVKAEKRLSMMRRSKHILPRSCLDKLYKSMILPLFNYCDVIYDLVPCMKENNLTNCKGKPAYYVLVHSGSPAMKNH